MDAESTYVGPGFAGRTRPREPAGPVGLHARPDIRDAEVRIVEDVKKIQKAFTPENIANYLISAIRKEMLGRVEAMNLQRINEMSDKVRTGAVEAAKGHPGITALTGLGVSWFIFDNMLRQKSVNGQIIEQLQETTEQIAKTTIPHLKESAKEAGEIVTRRSQSVMNEISNYMDENPMTVGFIGLSAGLILGILTSGVLKGNDFLDETRRTVKQKTREMLKQTKEKAGYVVEAAREAAREEAERQNLLPH